MSKKTKRFQVRQGDVLVEMIDGEIPSTEIAPRDAQGRVVLAEGEATGHAHAIHQPEAVMFAGGMMDMRDAPIKVDFLSSESTMLLRHEEHRHIELPAGRFRVIRQREYTPQGIRNVAD